MVPRSDRQLLQIMGGEHVNEIVLKGERFGTPTVSFTKNYVKKKPVGRECMQEVGHGVCV